MKRLSIQFHAFLVFAVSLSSGIPALAEISLTKPIISEEGNIVCPDGSYTHQDFFFYSSYKLEPFDDTEWIVGKEEDGTTLLGPFVSGLSSMNEKMRNVYKTVSHFYTLKKEIDMSTTNKIYEQLNVFLNRYGSQALKSGNYVSDSMSFKPHEYMHGRSISFDLSNAAGKRLKLSYTTPYFTLNNGTKTIKLEPQHWVSRIRCYRSNEEEQYELYVKTAYLFRDLHLINCGAGEEHLPCRQETGYLPPMFWVKSHFIRNTKPKKIDKDFQF